MSMNQAVPIRGFPPIADAHARMLILGSMPSEASLRAGQYYAHPRNLFWRILGELTGVAVERPYRQRAEALTAAGIALWDVIASCRRDGSLDASIEADSVLVNDFAAFFRAHSDITHVFFNGTQAEASYRRHVLPQLATATLNYTRLPSTSPAHAARTLAQKSAIWLENLAPALQTLD